MNRWLAATAFLMVTTLGWAAEKDRSDRPPQVGDMAPDIMLTGIDGKEFKLSEITASGRHVGLIFSRAHW